MSYKIKIITSTSLFDGHDASINIMRRILQDQGVEVIHLGHNRSCYEIALAAMEEDVQGIALTSYQGGHVEFFLYLRKILDLSGYSHIKIVGGGGGTILPEEATFLEKNGISKIYLPEDGLKLGLEGMIKEVISICNFPILTNFKAKTKWSIDKSNDFRLLSRQLTCLENNIKSKKIKSQRKVAVVGITGTGGAGKSSVTDELVRFFLLANPQKTVAILSVDPTKQKSGGALLGDRIRMNILSHPNVFMRSVATRSSKSSLNQYLAQMIDCCKNHNFDLIVVESAGVGQNDCSIKDFCPLTLYVMTPEYGAASQLEKINMLDFADIICLNKFDTQGSQDALHDIKKQYKRNHKIFDSDFENLPIFGTVASQFNDAGILNLFQCFIEKLQQKFKLNFQTIQDFSHIQHNYSPIIPQHKKQYLLAIVNTIRNYNSENKKQADLASQWYQLDGCLKQIDSLKTNKEINQKLQELKNKLLPDIISQIENWSELKKKYQASHLIFGVRGQQKTLPLTFITQSGQTLSRISLPKYKDWGDIVRWLGQENVPGQFPFTAGVYELKRENEDPTRMFAGEGCPERTNHRFHFLAQDQQAIRLSTAFDSVTLYGEDPDLRDDIFGKVGNSGVSIASLDDAKKLYSGFDLNQPNTSVSMTINGPAPIILAFFLNAAIDQACEKYITEHKRWPAVNTVISRYFKNRHKPYYEHPEFKQNLPKTHQGIGLKLLGISGDQVLEPHIYQQIKSQVLQQVRGTVQADILKEDQAQNTCIFSTDFALKLMGDIQVYFAENKIRNFYSISVSGYHIAEAGANPITQLAFTLANGFTFVEYFLHRGIDINQFSPNLSFFFSNGMDAEYAVMGRVARRIWSKALKKLYQADDRAQKLKYHIQTSGRSLHAQEIDFNDIRTTLQALYAIYDQCNSLHTNSYDEAITTPTQESVRRALAIQLIINKELGTTKLENINQGSFVIEELTDLVEEAVLAEFERLNNRGGVLPAMERMYQRHKIQDESLDYETKKHKGIIPIVGVNTFIGDEKINWAAKEVFRSTSAEKKKQIMNVRQFKENNHQKAEEYLKLVQQAALKRENIFAILMEAVKYCTLGQLSNCLYEVGGKYRRNM